MLKFLETIDLTVIVALIAAISAILSPLITEIIRQKGVRKEKSIELYFNAKMEAYTKYLQTIAQFPPSPSKDDLFILGEVLNQAVFLSTEDTGRKIALHTKYLTELSHQKSFSEAGWPAYGDAYFDMLMAMRHEFEKYCE